MLADCPAIYQIPIIHESIGGHLSRDPFLGLYTRTCLFKNDSAILPGRVGLFHPTPLPDLENSEPEFPANVGIVQNQVPMQSKKPFQTDFGQQ
jgi:hypothetical protein